MANHRASITDIAKVLGLSVSTISRALADHRDVSEDTKARVRQVAKDLNYRPNHLAAALRKGRSNTLGVLVPYITGNFFSVVVNGIETAATKAGLNVMICQSNENVLHEKRNLETLLNAQVDGFLVSLARTTHNLDHFAGIQELNIPLVFFDRILEGSDVSAIVVDDRLGAYQVVRHLIEQGSRRIAHFAGPQHLNVWKNRFQGYLDALRDFGLPFDDSLVYHCDMTEQSGVAGTRKFLQMSPLPDAIFAAVDIVAVEAMQVLKEHRIRIPEEIALAGFSNEAFTMFTEPRLTSVDQCGEQMGQQAVQMMQEMLASHSGHFIPRRVVLSPKLKIRDSTLRHSSLLID
ncbi:LacI family DNA-binding transcriptional regulator [Hymenobacter jejuensis]|uniref:LacI family transcriptional regulator n=1 Tax=Hymenobacter jejuensis TaxID=2502781 RepID=A0A5B7ZYL4_9BACT|nr:LacI family DNA-binding transcriptional regulator [Hymenobacter jejuensis]QDA60284.1 LacI family transcriptional regulator [Hymenobacter jejuensis]